MRHDPQRHPVPRGRELHPAATLLTVEAVGLAALSAAFLGAGIIVAAGLGVALAAVAGGLAASIGEGFPDSGGAVLGFEGVTLAFAASQWSVVAAVAVHHRRAGAGQIRRPVPCQ